MEFFAIEDEGTRLEGFKMEGGEVEEFSGFGVGIEVDLEASVEEEAVEFIGADAAADAIGGFEDLDGDSFFVKVEGAGEARKTGADDEDGLHLEL